MTIIPPLKNGDADVMYHPPTNRYYYTTVVEERDTVAKKLEAYGMPKTKAEKIADLGVQYANGLACVKRAHAILEMVRDYGRLCTCAFDPNTTAADRVQAGMQSMAKFEEIGRALGAVSLPDAPAQGEQG